MDGWMYECMDGWMDGWMNAWMDGCMYVWMNECIDGWMNACMDGWMNEWGVMPVCMSSYMTVGYGHAIMTYMSWQRKEGRV